MYNVYDLTNISNNPMSKFRVEAFAGLLLVSHLDFRWNFVYDFPPNFADIQNYSASSLSMGFKIPLSQTSSKIVQKPQRRAEIYMKNFGEFFNNQVESAKTIIYMLIILIILYFIMRVLRNK